MAESTKVPLPEPSAWQVRRNDYGLWASQYWEECSEWEAKNCVAAADLRQLYTAENLHAHAAAVSAAKDAEIERLRETAKALYEGTMRQAAEIAQLRAELIKSLADNAALRAEVAGLREDAERLDFLLHKLPGDSLRYVLGELSDTSDEAEFRAAIDAARKQKP